MTRPRKHNKHLPPCVYLQHGAYYWVRAGKWHFLDRDYAAALAAYARLAGQSATSPPGSIGALLDRVLEDAAARCAPSTARAYRVAVAALRPILVEFEPDQVKPRHIAAIMDTWATKPAMANRLRTVLKLVFDLAVRAGQCDANPVSSIAPNATRKRTRYLTDQEYQAIWTAAPPALRCIMDLAYLTGQRIGDVLAIRLIDLTERGIEIDQDKTGKRLTIRWTPDLRAAVEAAKALHSTAKLILLAQRNGKPRGYFGVRDLWTRACRSAGVEDAHLHDLRAKAITDARRQGLNPQYLAGHTTEAQTVRYLRDRTRDEVDGPALPDLMQNHFRQFDTGTNK